jgi:uncharacterized protein YjcR
MRRENKLSEETWIAIRNDYLTSDISLRGLEKKYGISFSAIRNRCEREKWVEQRKVVSTQTAQKSLDLLSTHQAEEATKAFMVANKLLEKIERSVDAVDDGDTGAIKQLTGAIKDLKEIGIFRADLDRAEQMARIKKLQKEAEEEQTDTTITVKIESGEDYAD